MPKLADKVVYFFAPVISTTTAFTAFSVIPFGPMCRSSAITRRCN